MLILKGTLIRLGDRTFDSLTSLDALAWRITKETPVFWITPSSEIIGRPIHTEVTLMSLQVYIEIFDSARARTLKQIVEARPESLGVLAYFVGEAQQEIAYISILERHQAAHPIVPYAGAAFDETVVEDEPTIPDIRILNADDEDDF